MRKTIAGLKTPWYMSNLCNQSPFLEFGFEVDELKNIKSVIVNDSIIPFMDDRSPYWIRNIYGCITGHKYFLDRETEALIEFYKTITISSDIVIYSNNSNPYCGCKPDEKKNRRVYPETLFDLCECFMQIQDTEDRFCAYWNNSNALVFYYTWKE